MKSGALWEVSITVPVEVEEAVTGLLEHVTRLPVALYTDEETLISRVSAYCPRRGLWTASRRARLEKGLVRLRKEGLLTGPARIRVRTIPRQDWSESWKHHFKPIEIGERLLLKPGWSRRKPRPGQAVVVLDPGLSFGTGQHATTRFCLRELVARRKSGKPQALLDIGTGSGILAIAAAKLGYQPVDAFDFDPESVRAARANSETNCTADLIRIERRDLRKLPIRAARRYDVVCANLLLDLLLEERIRILNRLAPGGILILAGILRTQFPRVRDACCQSGLRLLRSREEKEWRSGAFAFAKRAGTC
ncbi:MAG TPA: 50S ribosomal protein L11 methyltransferase [Methylomirabilota bacterium]|nr:50S ribosomal protein L11 methyltransferase [Methylomirabilota bacterium]